MIWVYVYTRNSHMEERFPILNSIGEAEEAILIH